VIVLPDGCFASESVYARSILEEHPDYNYAPHRRQKIQTKQGSYFVLLNRWSKARNYYHWLHDSILKLFRVIEWLPDDVRYVVPENVTELQRETLRTVGVKEDQLIPFAPGDIWELETLYFCNHTTNSGTDRLEADLWLRDTVLAAYQIELGPAKRRIYVSRQQAKDRRLVNEGTVQGYLEEHGFETHVLETLPFRRQVELFAQAEVVLAPHGAGLTNILFSPPGLTVVEMIPQDIVRQAYVYWTMADALGHSYWYLVTESLPRDGQPYGDAHVPLEKLAATFGGLGLSARADS
jgi:capsular polysaccharide biosynthesis protein